MASTTLAATCSGPTVPNGLSPVLIMPGITTLTPTGASIAASSARKPVGDAEHAVLRRGVGPDARDRGDRRHRRGVHHVTRLAGREDAGHERADPVDHAPQVDVDHAVPVRERQLPGVALHDDAGVVHRDVQLPEVLDRGVGGALDRVGIGHVDDQRPHLGATIGETLGVRREPRLVEVGHEHAHPRGDERLGDREADPARRAGHDRGAAVQFS